MPLSAYEQERLRNIAANQAKLVELGIEDPIKADKAMKDKAVKGAAVNKKLKSERPPARPHSLRGQNRDVDGNPLPNKPEKPLLPEPEPKRQRLASVPLDAAKVSTGATSAEEAGAFLARLGALSGSAKTSASPVTSGKKKQKASVPVGPPPIVLDQLAVDEDDIAKLVPERIFSIAVHPSPTKLLVAAGDTWGRVGLWDVDAGDEQPVATFEPHRRPVSGVRMLSAAPHQLLSCSHDGAVRCLDLGRGTASSFVELYRTPEDEDGDYPMLFDVSRTAGEGGALAVSRGDGAVVLLDTRLGGASSSGSGGRGAAALMRAHEKKVYCADFSPTEPWLLSTASIDRTVRVWDVRKLGEKKPKPLVELGHGLAVTAARFSPSGTRLLTTCNDDKLRVYDSAAWGGASSSSASSSAKGGRGSASEPAATVKHENKTGRFLTAFQAEWVRGSDEDFVCGSLSHPRGIDVYSHHGATQPRLEHDHVTAVVSLLAWHPTLPALASSNASGKVFLWRS